MSKIAMGKILGTCFKYSLSRLKMFIAMNRFKVASGSEDDFISIWKNRETFLDTVPGFKEFYLLKGPSTEE